MTYGAPVWEEAIKKQRLLRKMQSRDEHGQFSSLVGIYVVVPTMLACTAVSHSQCC